MSSQNAIPENLLPARIQLFIHDLSGGGSERQIVCLANDLVDRVGVQAVQLVTIGSTDKDRYKLDARIERLGLNLSSERGGWVRGLLANSKRISALRKVAKEWKPDVVLSFCEGTNILVLEALGRRYPVLISERHDPRTQSLSKLWAYLKKRAYPKAKVCVVQSDEVAAYLEKEGFRGSPTHVVVIPSAIVAPKLDREKISNERSQANPKVCLFVGRLAREKRVDRLLQAWAKIADKHPDWRLRLVGEGPLKSELQQLARELKIDGRIDWIDWKSDIWQEWKQANLFVLTSDTEGLPQSLLEGMTAGLPSVVTDCSPAIRKVFEEGSERVGSIGELVPIGENFSESLEKYLASESLRVEQGANAVAVSAPYQWSEIAVQWHAAIRGLTPGT